MPRRVSANPPQLQSLLERVYANPTVVAVNLGPEQAQAAQRWSRRPPPHNARSGAGIINCHRAASARDHLARSRRHSRAVPGATCSGLEQDQFLCRLGAQIRPDQPSAQDRRRHRRVDCIRSAAQRLTYTNRLHHECHGARRTARMRHSVGSGLLTLTIHSEGSSR